MAHLAAPRIGWENEHLATFLLSRISFVAHPMTVADDIGSDFFCNLFERVERPQHELLFARNSFGIQVKSTTETVDFTNKIEYLEKLELPFFIGVVDQNALRLSIYSGEYLPILFSEYGRPSRLRLCPTPGPVGDSYCEAESQGECTLKMPFVLDLHGSDNREDLLESGRQLRELCSRMHENISAKTSGEYVFKTNDPDKAIIMAGPGSYSTFRHNFQLRLAEVFFNLEWIYQHKREEFSPEEFHIYERCYQDLLRASSPMLLGVLRGIYERFKNRLMDSPVV